MQKIVLALGGNALGHSPQEQIEATQKAAVTIADLVCRGDAVVITHGNGPQVGQIKRAMGDMPMDACVAMTQGYIGFHLQLALKNELESRGVQQSVICVATPVLVDPADPAFGHPTKPVGVFYTREQAEAMMAAGAPMVEDAGRGWRKVVASPKPQAIIEWETIRDLSAQGHIVIAAGGGGIPVIRQDGRLQGIEAVIDKDYASLVLAKELEADVLLMLTAVEKVAIHFGKPEQQWLDRLTPAEARQYIQEGHFAPGSMLPKVRAALEFAESAPGRRALITHLETAVAGIEGRTGTLVRED